MVRDINRAMFWFWLFAMLFAGVLVWATLFMVHKAHAKAYDNQEISRHAQDELKIRPRGPGGPPVVIPDDVTKDRWQIKIAIYSDGPGGALLTFGTPQEGPFEWGTRAECEMAIKKDKRLSSTAAQMKQALPPGHEMYAFCVHFAGGERVD